MPEQDPGREREGPAEVRVDRLELRDDEQEHRGQDQHHQGDHDDRVGHRGLDLASELDLLLDLVGQRQEDVVEHTAGLAGLDHRDEQVVEGLRVLGQGARERRPLFDVGPRLHQDLLELLVVGLIREDRERPQDRQTRVDHRRELPAEDRDRLELDPARPQVDLHLHAGAGLLDLDRGHPHLAQALEDQRLAVPHQLPGDQAPRPVPDLVVVGLRHRGGPPDQ